MSSRQLFHKAKNYKADILKNIKKINNLIANPENSFQLDGSKFKGIEFPVYHQESPDIDESVLGLKQLLKEKLPALQYHNPNFKITVHNIVLTDEKLKQGFKIDHSLKVYGVDSKNDLSIECAGKSGSKIYDELIKRTGATQIVDLELNQIPLQPTK